MTSDSVSGRLAKRKRLYKVEDESDTNVDTRNSDRADSRNVSNEPATKGNQRQGTELKASATTKPTE